jgi:sporulation protein YlmC with PRC-barrel domain
MDGIRDEIGPQQVSLYTEEPHIPPAMGEGCELSLDFDVGAAVHCQDGTCGKLLHVVLDPSSGKVTDLVVRHGFLQQQNRVVPVARVRQLRAEGIWLSLSSDEVRQCTEYREIEFRVPAVPQQHGRYQSGDVRYAMSPYEGLKGQSVSPAQRYTFREGIPYESRTIGRGIKLRDARGVFGEVDHVLVDCHEGEITHLIIRRGLLGEYRIVPMAYVADVDEQAVLLKGTRADLDPLPVYHPRHAHA